MKNEIKWVLGGIGVVAIYAYFKKKNVKTEDSPVIENKVSPIETSTSKFSPENTLKEVESITASWWAARKPNNLGITRKIVTGDGVGLPQMELGQYSEKVKLMDNEYKKKIDSLAKTALNEGYILKRKDNTLAVTERRNNATEFEPLDTRMLAPTYTITKIEKK